MQSPSAKVRTLQFLSSMFAAPFIGALFFVVVGFIISIFNQDAFSDDSFALPTIFILVGSSLMYFLHKPYQRMRVVQIVFLTFACIALVFAPLFIYWGVTGLEELAIQKKDYRLNKPDGPPPDFMGLSSGISKSLKSAGYFFLITGAPMACSCLFGIAGRKALAKETPPAIPSTPAPPPHLG